MPRRRSAPSAETPWRSGTPREPGLYICLCQFAFFGDEPDDSLFPEVLRFESDGVNEAGWKGAEHLRVRYWFPCPPAPQEAFDGIF